MPGSTFGKLFRVTTWGESHGNAIGAVIDGCPAGIEINENYIYEYLKLRRPSSNITSTSRNEDDKPVILSGIFEGKTTGSPISVIVYNKDRRSEDYSNIKDTFRPSHADYTYFCKYSNVDYRGGGRSSGRETVARVIGGAIAKKILNMMNISVYSYVSSIGNIIVKDIDRSIKNELNIPNIDSYKKCLNYLKEIRTMKDSIGSSCHITVNNLPSGIGEPVFDKLDAQLAKAIMSIGGVKSVGIGLGKTSSTLLGSIYNDDFNITENNIVTETNNSGGILGGISNSMPIEIDAYFKPTPSIGIKQKTVDKYFNSLDIEIGGRHDPVLAIRGFIVAESMVSITLVDLIMQNSIAKIENIMKIYN